MGSRSPGRRVAVALSLLLACFVLAPAAGAAGTRFSSNEARVVGLINQIRATHLAPPLKLSSPLERAARSHSLDMIRHHYFGHGNVTARLRSFGVTSPLIGENLAWDSGSTVVPGQIVHLWLESPGHRRVMLLRGFHRIGLAMPIGPFGGYSAAVVVTADFSA